VHDATLHYNTTDGYVASAAPSVAAAASCNSFLSLPQEARTLEELQLQRMERARAIAYFEFMQQQAAARAAAKLAACDQLEQAVEQQLVDHPDAWKSVVSVQEQVDEIFQLRTEHTLMLRWSKRFETLQQTAAQRFASL
jgi:hypothetical protein